MFRVMHPVTIALTLVTIGLESRLENENVMTRIKAWYW